MVICLTSYILQGQENGHLNRPQGKTFMTLCSSCTIASCQDKLFFLPFITTIYSNV